MEQSARDDAFAGLALLLLVAVFGFATADIYVSPFDEGIGARDLPAALLTLIGLGGLFLIGRSVYRLAQNGEPLAKRDDLQSLLLGTLPIIGLSFLYIWLLVIAQYVLPTILIFSATLALFGNRGWRALVALPIAGTLVFYVLFYGLLGLFEPEGALIAYNSRPIFAPVRSLVGL